MKSVAILIAGVILGIGIDYFGVENIKAFGKHSVEKGEQVAKGEKYDLCVDRFNSETSCFQTQPIPKCEEQIFRKCGRNPAIHGKMDE